MESTEATVSNEVSNINDSQPQLIKNNRNALHIRCAECGSVILSPGIAQYTPSKPYSLPLCRQKKDGIAVAKEKVETWWRIEKMLDFDNIGFTHAYEGVKYLVCADCEMGPVGYLSLESQSHYIALSRVAHGDFEPRDLISTANGDVVAERDRTESS